MRAPGRCVGGAAGLRHTPGRRSDDEHRPACAALAGAADTGPDLPRRPLSAKGETAPINSTVRKGSTGQQVKAAQTELNKVGKELNVDGRFGDGTDKAVRDFQSDVGLPNDGIVGPNTWRELITRREVS
jgi:zinc D-Ala-D-Ala carboxypeptidase